MFVKREGMVACGERRNDSIWGMRNVCVEKKNGCVWRAKE
jgi:hypothetical protein